MSHIIQPISEGNPGVGAASATTSTQPTSSQSPTFTDGFLLAFYALQKTMDACMDVIQTQELQSQLLVNSETEYTTNAGKIGTTIIPVGASESDINNITTENEQASLQRGIWNTKEQNAQQAGQLLIGNVQSNTNATQEIVQILTSINDCLTQTTQNIRSMSTGH